MDIEFVCSISNDLSDKKYTINIVQVMAIPEGNKNVRVPYDLSSKFLGDNKAKLLTMNALKVITPEVNRATVITNNQQVIIASTIEEALSRFNTMGKDSGIKVVNC